jgi:hypothetical protein
MEDQLITFETAKLAKEKGFNEGLIGMSRGDSASYRKGFIEILAPTQSLLQRWLREVHKFIVEVSFDFTETYTYYCAIIEVREPTNEPLYYSIDVFDKATYEEALEQGLQEALKFIKL